MKVYISGPIATPIAGTGREERRARFWRCHKWINNHRAEWSVVNPLEVDACVDTDDIRCELGPYNTTHTWACYLRHDLKAMLECDGIVLLPGWDLSAGALLEQMVAKELGFTVYIADSSGRIVI